MTVSHRILIIHFCIKALPYHPSLPSSSLWPPLFYLLACCHCHSSSFPWHEVCWGVVQLVCPYICVVFNSQEVIGNLTLVVKQVLHLCTVSITWWKQTKKRIGINSSELVKVYSMLKKRGFMCTEKVLTLYLRGIRTCKLVLHRTCTDSASRCSGNQTQPCLGKGWPPPVKEERLEIRCCRIKVRNTPHSWVKWRSEPAGLIKEQSTCKDYHLYNKYETYPFLLLDVENAFYRLG